MLNSRIWPLGWTETIQQNSTDFVWHNYWILKMPNWRLIATHRAFYLSLVPLHPPGSLFYAYLFCRNHLIFWMKSISFWYFYISRMSIDDGCVILLLNITSRMISCKMANLYNDIYLHYFWMQLLQYRWVHILSDHKNPNEVDEYHPKEIVYLCVRYLFQIKYLDLRYYSYLNWDITMFWW